MTDHELAVLVIYPGLDAGRGRGFNPAVVEVPSLQGSGRGVHLGMLVRGGALMPMETMAHELAHQTLKLDDLYAVGKYPGVGPFSLMDAASPGADTHRWAKHLDPWSKIKLGWLSPQVINHSGL